MRSVIALLLISLFVLAACGSGEVANETPEQNPDSQTVDDPTPDEESTEEAIVLVTLPASTPEGALPIPEPGTLVASETEDPNMGLVFDRIELVRYGGPDGSERIEIVVNQDGSYSRNEATGTITQDHVTEIDDLIDAMNFFGMQGAMLGPSSETDNYRWSMLVIRSDDERLVQAEDGFYPPEFQQLLAAIMRVQ